MSENMSTKDNLNDAAREGNINLLYTLIQQDPHVLKRIDEIPFVETPLHVAAAAGQLEFAAEIMRLKPSFALKPNPEGFCPIHLALQGGQRRMVLRFVKINKDLVRAQGRKGITPLHLASQNGDFGLLYKFLEDCPDSIEDVTARGETALHIAVKNKQYGAAEYLVDWLSINVTRGAIELEKTILNWKDENGNTIWHILALNSDLQVLSQILRCVPRRRNKIDLYATNVDGKTASDIASNPEIKISLKAAECTSLGDIAFTLMVLPIRSWISVISEYLRRVWSISEKQRNAYLVVAALIATATYQAALSPPGGLYQADPGTENTLSHLKTIDSSMNWKRKTGMGGNAVMTDLDFIMFSSTNMSSFFISTFAIIYLVPRNMIWWKILFALTVFLQLSYIFSMMVISPSRATTSFLVSLSVIWMVVGYVLYIIHNIGWELDLDPESRDKKKRTT